ncbi:MAG: hypothetical protein KQI35_13530 [Bacteroidetes bacterium]|nr:hypothetical protein [Bacteroidota bacterium]
MGYYGFGLGLKTKPNKPRKLYGKRTGLFERNLADDIQDIHNDKFYDKSRKSNGINISRRNRALFNPDQDGRMVKKMILGLLALVIIAAILLIWAF